MKFEVLYRFRGTKKGVRFVETVWNDFVPMNEINPLKCKQFYSEHSASNRALYLMNSSNNLGITSFSVIESRVRF